MESSKIRWGLGYTMNTGNFQSLRIDVSIEDFPREGEDIKEASNRIYSFVEQELSNKIKEAREELA